MTLVIMVAIGIGSVSAGGSDVATPIVGTLVLGLYALALAGIGIAVRRPRDDRVRGRDHRRCS